MECVLRDKLPDMMFPVDLRGSKTPRGIICRDCRSTSPAPDDYTVGSVWRCPRCAKEREERILAHIERIENDPLLRGL